MNVVDIIVKKKSKEILTKEEINFVIENYTNGNIKDYQMSSLLMAICINELNNEEIFYLTDAMLKSGETIDLSKVEGIKVDKHSTGGIGDKTTLILSPLVASIGVKAPKMSGRGLGITGGTIDKLESIKGFNVNTNLKDFVKEVNEIGTALVGQTGNLVPADKKIYALRDVTGTTNSLGLIAASIMSKKIASGADKYVIDVKYGKGAFMKTPKDAKKLADIMIEIGKRYGKEVVCFITDMNKPLGCAVGNGLEVCEAIEMLIGNGPEDLTDLVKTLAREMVSLGLGISSREALNKIEENLTNGKAYEKFKEMVKYQNGDINKIEISNSNIDIYSDKEGYIHEIDALKIGKFVGDLGASRKAKEDNIDYGVGIVLSKQVSDYVKKGEKLLSVYYNKKINFEIVKDAFVIKKEKKEKEPVVQKVVR
jgi:pyrimidine-nucleoside phosphorylase